MGKNCMVAVITGVTGGIGKAIAESFAQKGTRIAGVARNKQRVNEVLRHMHQIYGAEFLAIEADVSRIEDVENMVSVVMEKFKRIDVLINNAGVGIFDSIINVEPKDWEYIMDVNLKGVYLCARAVLNYMMKQKSGMIINISSVCGLRGYAQCGAYCASKFGVVGFTEALAHEVSPYNIAAFAVCPDIVDTSFANNRNAALTDKMNMLTPQEVAKVVVDLVKSGAKSQICEITLHPLTFLWRMIGVQKRKVSVKRIKFL